MTFTVFITISLSFGCVLAPSCIPLTPLTLFCLCSSLTEALRIVIEAAKPGVSVLSLCEKGDAHIMAETGKIFKREKDMKKG